MEKIEVTAADRDAFINQGRGSLLDFISEARSISCHSLAKHVLQKDRHAFLINELKGFTGVEDRCLITAKKGGRTVGLCAFLRSEWDSSLFGFGYGSIRHLAAEGDYRESSEIYGRIIDYVLSWARDNNINFIHCRIDASALPQIHSLEKNRFRLISIVGSFILLSRGIRLLKRKSANTYTVCSGSEAEDIKGISRFIFTDNRIFLDKRFSAVQVQRLYEKWIENSCAGIVQDKVFVYRTAGGDIAGFVSCGKKKAESEHFGRRVGTVDLLGIGKDYQKKGIGVYTLDAACRWLKDNMDITCAVMALNNRAVIRTAEYFGFTLTDVLTDLHWWSTDP